VRGDIPIRAVKRLDHQTLTPPKPEQEARKVGVRHIEVVVVPPFEDDTLPLMVEDQALPPRHDGERAVRATARPGVL